MKNLQCLINELSERRMKSNRSYNPRKYVSTWLEDDVLPNTKTVVKALVVILRTHGCSWARKATADATAIGGCSMCGYINDCISASAQQKPDDIIYQFQSALNKFQDAQFEIVKIFTSGSFFDETEVPGKVQRAILEMVTDLSIEHLIVESRPEFVTVEKLTELTSCFNGNAQVALGLESANDNVLRYSINKGFTFNDYCSAVKIAQKTDVSVKTYLLLKPPFLTERDAINDVLSSIQKLRDKKLTDCISINPVNIQKFTVVERLFHRNVYRPSWLWSVVNVLTKGHDILAGTNIRILSSPTAGGLRQGAHNCGACDQMQMKAINEFSLSNDPAVLQGLNCPCHAKWLDTLELENIVKSVIDPAPTMI